MLENILNIIPSNLAYLIVFLASLIESSPLVGLVFPGQTFVIIAGFAAHEHVLNLILVIVFASIGAIIGDMIAYYLGKKYGLKFLIKYGKYFFFKKSYIKKIEPYVKNHYGKGVLFGRLNPLSKSLVPFLVGVHKINFKKFMLFNILGGFIWAIAYSAVGYIFGEGYKIIQKYTGRITTILILLIILVYYIIYQIKKPKKLNSVHLNTRKS